MELIWNGNWTTDKEKAPPEWKEFHYKKTCFGVEIYNNPHKLKEDEKMFDEVCTVYCSCDEVFYRLLGRSNAICWKYWESK